MEITFDTSSIGQSEARGLISLLSALLADSTPQSTPSSPIPTPVAPVPMQIHTSEVAQYSEPATQSAEPQPVQAINESFPVRRGRRTKADVEAAQAAQATQTASTDPTHGATASSAATSAEASGTTQSAPAPTGTAPAGDGAIKITADDLRGLLNGYIQKHSMEAAIEKLKAFGCNRVSEALELDPAKLNELAEALRG